MSNSSSKIQKTETIHDLIVISSSDQELEVPIKKIIKICWNTGEEKIVYHANLSKGCKAKT